MDLPNRKTPCKNCPFRKDCLKGWLGKERMEEIINARSFVCHKNNNLQCAGHIILNGNDNDFQLLANRLHIDLKIKNKELIFESKKDCINHHK